MYHRIKYFLKAAETGSFSVAAQKLYVTPPALTKQIKILEEELGGKLFIRTPQGVSLTPMGQFAYDKLAMVSKVTDDAIEDLRSFALNNKTRVRIGFFSGLSVDDLITPVVSFLMTFFPQYQISFEILEFEEGLKKLDEGKLDMLLTQISEEEEKERYSYLSFGEQEAQVIVSLTHPWVLKDRISAEDLQQETFFRFSASAEDEENYSLHVPCKSIKTVSNFKTIMMMLKQGEGFTLFPIDQQGISREHLKSFEYPGERLLYNTALVYRKKDNPDGLGKIVSDLTSEFDLIPC